MTVKDTLEKVEREKFNSATSLKYSAGRLELIRKEETIKPTTERNQPMSAPSTSDVEQMKDMREAIGLPREPKPGEFLIPDIEDSLPEEKRYPFFRDKNGTIHYDEEGFPIMFPDATLRERRMWDAHSYECSGEDYVLGPAKTAKFEGWFPLGEVSLIGGSSGAGKTTWALQMLDAQSKGEEFLGHESYELPYIILMKDRSKFGLKRTFRRLEMDMDNLPLREFPKECPTKMHFADALVMLVEAEMKAGRGSPRIVFFEGLDIMIPDNFKMADVASVLEPAQGVAERYNFALICTMGSPKKSPKEQYSSPRDAIFGSSVFPRMTETIVKVTEDYTTGAREVIVLPRQEAQERFSMKFRDGKIVLGLPVGPAGPNLSKQEEFNLWLTPGSTWEQAHERFGISRATFYGWRKSAEKNSPAEPAQASPADSPASTGWTDFLLTSE
jgi:AAA domain